MKNSEIEREQHKNIVLLYDPQSKKRFGPFSNNSNSPIEHAVMVAIQEWGSSLLKYMDSNRGKEGTEQGREVQDKLPICSLESSLETLEEKEKPSISISGRKRKQRESSANIEFDINDRASESEQYYCTGLYLFAYREPCFMCSMALVHSRIARVYYLEPNKNEGGLGGCDEQVKINYLENLNHHFTTFRVKFL